MVNEVKIKMTADDLASGKIKGVGKTAGTTTEKLRGMRGQFLAVGAAGGAILGSLGIATKTFAQTGDEIQKMSLRTSISTEALSEMRFALEQSGSSIEGMEKGVRRMTSFIQDGRDGLTETTRALDTMGVSVSDFEGAKPEEAFNLLTTALANVEDEITQAALAQDIFGRSGTALLPLLAQGADGIDALKQEAHDLGIVFDQDMADSAARLIDAQNTMGKSVEGLQIAFAQHLAPALSGVLETVGAAIGSFSEWADNNPALAQTLVVVAGLLGGLLITVGLLGIGLPILATGFGFVATGIGAVTGMTWGATTAFIAANAATGGIIIAIGLLVTGLILMVMNWDKVVRAIKIGINFMTGMFEKYANTFIFLINKIIDGINKVAGIFGKEIDHIAEVEIPKFDTAVEEMEETTEEAADGIGDSMEDLQYDFEKTADSAEEEAKRAADAWIESMEKIEDAHNQKVKDHLLSSKLEGELYDRKRERDNNIAKWEQEQADKAMALAMKEAEAIVAASDKRFEDIRVSREQDLAHDLNVADVRSEAGEALLDQNMEAFEDIRSSVSALPSVEKTSGLNPLLAGSGWMGEDQKKMKSVWSQDYSSSVMRVLGSVQATRNAAGDLIAKSITGKDVVIQPVNITIQGDVNNADDDFENKMTQALQTAMQKGAIMQNTGGLNPGDES
jgi:TP901 family phage tail tape measure protein